MTEAVRPAADEPLPEVQTAMGATRSTNLSNCDLAVPGSPRRRTLMSPRRLRPSGSRLREPPKSKEAIHFFTSSKPKMDGAMDLQKTERIKFQIEKQLYLKREIGLGNTQKLRLSMQVEQRLNEQAQKDQYNIVGVVQRSSHAFTEFDPFQTCPRQKNYRRHLMLEISSLPGND